MATYDEIYANYRWFRQQIIAIGLIVDRCERLDRATSCVNVPDSEWPDALAQVQVKYGEVTGMVNGRGKVGYQTGTARLRHLAIGLHTTLQAYLRAEADSETEIRERILALLDS